MSAVLAQEVAGSFDRQSILCSEAAGDGVKIVNANVQKREESELPYGIIKREEIRGLLRQAVEMLSGRSTASISSTRCRGVQRNRHSADPEHQGLVSKAQLAPGSNVVAKIPRAQIGPHQQRICPPRRTSPLISVTVGNPSQLRQPEIEMYFDVAKRFPPSRKNLAGKPVFTEEALSLEFRLHEACWQHAFESFQHEAINTQSSANWQRPILRRSRIRWCMNGPIDRSYTQYPQPSQGKIL